MPMIDVYATTGTFSHKRKLVQDLANAVMRWENVPPINLFKKNTAAFIQPFQRLVSVTHYSFLADMLHA